MIDLYTGFTEILKPGDLEDAIRDLKKVEYSDVDAWKNDEYMVLVTGE